MHFIRVVKNRRTSIESNVQTFLEAECLLKESRTLDLEWSLYKTDGSTQQLERVYTEHYAEIPLEPRNLGTVVLVQGIEDSWIHHDPLQNACFEFRAEAHHVLRCTDENAFESFVLRFLKIAAQEPRVIEITKQAICDTAKQGCSERQIEWLCAIKKMSGTHIKKFQLTEFVTSLG
jgi:hypothetical protein